MLGILRAAFSELLASRAPATQPPKPAAASVTPPQLPSRQPQQQATPSRSGPVTEAVAERAPARERTASVSPPQQLASATGQQPLNLQTGIPDAVASRAPVAPKKSPSAGATTGQQPAKEGFAGQIVDQIKRSFGLGAMPVEIVRDRTKDDHRGVAQRIKEAHANAVEAKQQGGSYWRSLMFGSEKRSELGAEMHQEDLAQENYPQTWKLDPARAVGAQKKWTELNNISGGKVVSSGVKSATAEVVAGSEAAAGAAASGAAGAGGAAAGAGAAGVGASAGLSSLIPGVGAVAAGLLVMGAAVAKFTGIQLQAAEQLSKFNGSIAMSMAAMRVGDIRRSIASGQATSGSTAEMVSALESLRDDFRPIGDALSNLTNKFITYSIELVKPVVQAAAFVVKYLPTLAKEKVDPADPNKALPFIGDLHDAARAARDRQTPPPANPPKR